MKKVMWLLVGLVFSLGTMAWAEETNDQVLQRHYLLSERIAKIQAQNQAAQLQVQVTIRDFKDTQGQLADTDNELVKRGYTVNADGTVVAPVKKEEKKDEGKKP